MGESCSALISLIISGCILYFFTTSSTNVPRVSRRLPTGRSKLDQQKKQLLEIGLTQR
jgi:hypothetical protein